MVTEPQLKDIIEALRAATPWYALPEGSQSSYSIFGAGGPSWKEVATLIEELAAGTAPTPELEYSYTHEYGTARGGATYVSIADPAYGPTWFATAEEAEAARANDLRWRPETFVIVRSKAGAPTRYIAPIEA